MQDQICDNEKAFIIEGLRLQKRRDLRTNLESRPYTVELGTVARAFGSSSLMFGDNET